MHQRQWNLTIDGTNKIGNVEANHTKWSIMRYHKANEQTNKEYKHDVRLDIECSILRCVYFFLSSLLVCVCVLIQLDCRYWAFWFSFDETFQFRHSQYFVSNLLLLIYAPLNVWYSFFFCIFYTFIENMLPRWNDVNMLDLIAMRIDVIKSQQAHRWIWFAAPVSSNIYIHVDKILTE